MNWMLYTRVYCTQSSIGYCQGKGSTGGDRGWFEESMSRRERVLEEEMEMEMEMVQVKTENQVADTLTEHLTRS